MDPIAQQMTIGRREKMDVTGSGLRGVTQDLHHGIVFAGGRLISPARPRQGRDAAIQAGQRLRLHVHGGVSHTRALELLNKYQHKRIGAVTHRDMQHLIVGQAQPFAQLRVHFPAFTGCRQYGRQRHNGFKCSHEGPQRTGGGIKGGICPGNIGIAGALLWVTLHTATNCKGTRRSPLAATTRSMVISVRTKPPGMV
ncbi:hypothetical protein D3C85_1279710 [compost metagenome]